MSEEFDFNAASEPKPSPGASFNPTVRKPKVPNTANQPSSNISLPVGEPIVAMRKRLADEWVLYKRTEAHRRWGKSGEKPDLSNLNDPQDSFVGWVTRSPEETVRRFSAERDDMDRPALEHKLKSDFKKALACASVPIFRCSIVNNADGTHTFRRVSLDELLNDVAYTLLSEEAQSVARFLVERCQFQKTDGSWTIGKVHSEDWVSVDEIPFFAGKPAWSKL